MKLIRRLLVAVIAIGAMAYVFAVLGLYFLQRDFQYDRSGRLFELSETTLTGAEVVQIPTADGATLTGWYEPPEAGKPLILFYRGNAQSFSREHERFEAFTAAGYGFLSFDYRGFPGSPGEITETNVLADGLAAFDWAAAKGFPILIWGRSLGSGPATYVASIREAEAVLLESPFLSAVAVAADRYGFMPVGLLMHDQYRVDEWVPKVTEPVFVAHGTLDRTIGVSHGERVYALAPNPGGVWIEEGGDHGNLWERGLWGRAQEFFESVMAAP